jgi:hypothetical protein
MRKERSLALARRCLSMSCAQDMCAMKLMYTRFCTKVASRTLDVPSRLASMGVVHPLNVLFSLWMLIQAHFFIHVRAYWACR